MFRLSLRIPGLSALPTGAGLESRILQRFLSEAGALLVSTVQQHLGQDNLYTLSPTYAQQKPKRKGFRRIGGKSSDQPLIFSASLFEGIEARLEGNSLIVDVQDGRGISQGGFDYAERWQEATDFLGLALADVEELLDGILLTIIFDEMGL